MNPNQPAQKVQDIKFCVNCVQFASPEKEGDVPRCHLSKMIDIVTGGKFYPACADMRHPNAPCGQDAKFFQPIPAPSSAVAPEQADLN